MLFNVIGCVFLTRNRMHNRNKMYKSADFAFSSHIHLISESCQDIFFFLVNETAISSNMNKIIIGAFVAAILCEYYINLKY